MWPLRFEASIVRFYNTDLLQSDLRRLSAQPDHGQSPERGSKVRQPARHQPDRTHQFPGTNFQSSQQHFPYYRLRKLLKF
jgi:hypothetical protein